MRERVSYLVDKQNKERTMLKRIVVAVVMVGWASLAAAQTTPIPVQYRVTRTAPSQPTIQHVFLKTAMVCDLPVANPAPPTGAGALRIEDPERPARDCEWFDQTNILGANRLPGVSYSFVIAGNAGSGYGLDSTAVVITLPGIPPAPPRFRYSPPPGAPNVAVGGTILRRFHEPAVNMDVAEIFLDIFPAKLLYIGSAPPGGLASPGDIIKPGNRFEMVAWQPTQP
jgi:hypothetical protein